MESQEVKKDSSDHQDGSDKRKIVIVIMAILILVIVGGLIYKFIENLELEKQNQITQAQLDLAYDELDSMSNELDVRILKIAQLGIEQAQEIEPHVRIVRLTRSCSHLRRTRIPSLQLGAHFGQILGGNPEEGERG